MRFKADVYVLLLEVEMPRGTKLMDSEISLSVEAIRQEKIISANIV